LRRTAILMRTENRRFDAPKCLLLSAPIPPPDDKRSGVMTVGHSAPANHAL
jgi:hypothetical protein